MTNFINISWAYIQRKTALLHLLFWVANALVYLLSIEYFFQIYSYQIFLFWTFQNIFCKIILFYGFGLIHRFYDFTEKLFWILFFILNFSVFNFYYRIPIFIKTYAIHNFLFSSEITDYYSKYQLHKPIIFDFNDYINLSLYFPPYILFLIFPTLIRILRRIYLTENQSQKLKIENENLELKELKIKIKWEFILNSFDELQKKLIKNDANAKTMILTFASVLRHILYFSNSPQNPLELELSHLVEYSNLKKFTNKNQTQLSIAPENINPNLNIIPGILVTIFDYLSDHSILQTNVEVLNQSLYFKIENNAKINFEDLKKQLNITIPNKYTIAEIKNHYIIKLEL